MSRNSPEKLLLNGRSLHTYIKNTPEDMQGFQTLLAEHELKKQALNPRDIMLALSECDKGQSYFWKKINGSSFVCSTKDISFYGGSALAGLIKSGTPKQLILYCDYYKEQIGRWATPELGMKNALFYASRENILTVTSYLSPSALLLFAYDFSNGYRFKNSTFLDTFTQQNPDRFPDLFHAVENDKSVQRKYAASFSDKKNPVFDQMVVAERARRALLDGLKMNNEAPSMSDPVARPKKLL